MSRFGQEGVSGEFSNLTTGKESSLLPVSFYKVLFCLLFCLFAKIALSAQ